MTEKDRERIIKLRSQGLGYRSIAATLDLSRDIVRNYCKTMGLNGYGKEIIERNEEVERIVDNEGIRCRNCGELLVQPKTGRKRHYCSITCKKEWQEKHFIEYSHVCQYCGKEFKNRSKNALFCSHKCYVRYRFWREEDIQMVMEFLKKEEPVPNVPGWIKKLVNGEPIGVQKYVE